MEVMVGAPSAVDSGTQDFLSGFELVELDAAVADRAVRLRREHGMKLPDAIIWASAQVRSMLLVTREEKGFPAEDPGVRMPYRV
jgi:predicted nucleic acid-binding protein